MLQCTMEIRQHSHASVSQNNMQNTCNNTLTDVCSLMHMSVCTFDFPNEEVHNQVN